MVSLNVRRNANLVDHIRHPVLQIHLGRFFHLKPLGGLRLHLMAYQVIGVLNPVQDHLVVEWLHDVIASAFPERIFCDPLLPDCRDDNKVRLFLQVFITSYHFHHA